MLYINQLKLELVSGARLHKLVHLLVCARLSKLLDLVLELLDSEVGTLLLKHLCGAPGRHGCQSAHLPNRIGDVDVQPALLSPSGSGGLQWPGSP